jgi:hypothetical protein
MSLGTLSTTFHSGEGLGYHGPLVGSVTESMSRTWETLQSRRQTRSLALFVCVGLSVLSAQQPVWAQSAQEKAMARSLFEEGVSLADQAKWPEAVDRFQRAQAIKPTPGVAFNLASALAETGKVIEASEMLESLVRDPTTPPELKSECEVKLTQISARRAYLTLQVQDAPSEGRVEVDGHDWPRAAWGVASPMDPGPHVIVGKTGGAEAARSEVELAAGERREVSLSWPKPVVAGPTKAAAAAKAPQAPSEPTHDDRKRPLYKNWILWTCTGAVVAGGVIAAVLLTNNDDPKVEAPIPANSGVIRW